MLELNVAEIICFVLSAAWKETRKGKAAMRLLLLHEMQWREAEWSVIHFRIHIFTLQSRLLRRSSPARTYN